MEALLRSCLLERTSEHGILNFFSHPRMPNPPSAHLKLEEPTEVHHSELVITLLESMHIHSLSPVAVHGGGSCHRRATQGRRG
jgi:hypothetical protein